MVDLTVWTLSMARFHFPGNSVKVAIGDEIGAWQPGPAGDVAAGHDTHLFLR